MIEDEWRDLRIGVLGTGRLGCSMARELAAVGARIERVFGRNPAASEGIAAEIGTRVASDSADFAAHCDLVFFTVPDREIENAVSALAYRAGQFVVYCSGALPLSALTALDAVRAGGAVAGCLHPLQAFPHRDLPVGHLRGITCGIEAPERLFAHLTALATAVGARPFDLSGANRARYHAAAVFASNSLVALAAAAQETWSAAGLSSDLAADALHPLMQGALENLAQVDLPARALTGPIARGDVETIRKHLDALEVTPSLRELYQSLGRVLLGLELGHTRARREALARELGSSRPVEAPRDRSND